MRPLHVYLLAGCLLALSIGLLTGLLADLVCLHDVLIMTDGYHICFGLFSRLVVSVNNLVDDRLRANFLAFRLSLRLLHN